MRHNLILTDEDNDLYTCTKCLQEGKYSDFQYSPCITVQGETESNEAVHKRECFKTTIALIDEDGDIHLY